MLKPAIDQSDGRWSLWDVVAGLLAGGMHLWVLLENDKITAACVTRFIQYPQMKALGLQFIGGKGALRAILAHEDDMKEWARTQGCTELEGYARKGWLKYLTHWKPSWTFITRRIDADN